MNKLLLIILYHSFFLTSFLLTAYNIPILMYHTIGYKKDRYCVTPEEFRTHLEKLYNAGYVTAPLSDILAKKPHLKKQKVVVFRFDGAKLSQFNYTTERKAISLLTRNAPLVSCWIFIKSIPRLASMRSLLYYPNALSSQSIVRKSSSFF